jgi:outer membrane protein OmpA-like peptidoglycan-associated protein
LIVLEVIMSSTMFLRCGLALAITIVFLAESVAQAQSLDPQKPAALASGINKGNVDNGSKGHFYYFWAGPGPIQIKMAFKEMGVMGAPFRQTLSFDFYDDNNKLVSHNVVVSLSDLARADASATFISHQRIRLAVLPQNGLVRLGGYYEIEITGAAMFDRAPSATSDVKPVDTSLYHSGGSLVNSGGSLVHPAGPLYKPEALVVSETDKEIHVVLAADVLFDFDRATIRPDAASALKQAAAVIRQHHGIVRIEGHTDSKGGSAYNLRLSNQRALAVETWLVRSEGFDIATFSAKGFGATRPVASNTNPDGSDNPEGRQRNRRVELVVAK